MVYFSYWVELKQNETHDNTKDSYIDRRYLLTYIYVVIADEKLIV